jgi:hypothetical protein
MPFHHTLSRRSFLTRSATAALATSIVPRAWAAPRKTPRILLRSSWQSVNIGDIGHTPGALSILNTHFPEAEVILWPGNLGHGSREMLTKGYPKLRIVEGSIDKNGKPTNEALAQAWDEADLYLSGSGSGFPAANHAVAFHKATNKPVGVFGVSSDPISGFGAGRDQEGGTLNNLRERALKLPSDHLAGDLRYIIDRASFFFCRDSITRDYLQAQGVKSPVVEFGPDAQLGMHLRDDAKGDAWLAQHQLEPGKFVCVIPRLRYTPYYKIRNTPPNETDHVKDAINDRTTEQDHAKLRDMMTAYIKATGNKVLVCAEMTYQVAMGKEVLVDPLPENIRRNVVWRDSYWLPDEAASIYARSLCVVSVECHSPLIALHQGTPTFHVRQPTDTCKGEMYRDIGAGEWLFEVDETNGAQLWAKLEAIHRDPAAARAKVKSIMTFVTDRQRHMVDVARKAMKI